MSQEIENNILELNRQAMDFLRENHHKVCLSYLKSAEESLRSREKTELVLKLLAITLNNFGCYWQKLGQPRQALKALKKALNYEKSYEEEPAKIAATHLNICAINSQIKEHTTALWHVNSALDLLQDQYDNGPNTFTTLIIAYHNLGVEHEHLTEYHDAIRAYEIGWQLAKQYLGKNHSLTKQLKASYKKTNKKSAGPMAKRRKASVDAADAYAAVNSSLPELHKRRDSLKKYQADSRNSQSIDFDIELPNIISAFSRNTVEEPTAHFRSPIRSPTKTPGKSSISSFKNDSQSPGRKPGLPTSSVAQKRSPKKTQSKPPTQPIPNYGSSPNKSRGKALSLPQSPPKTQSSKPTFAEITQKFSRETRVRVPSKIPSPDPVKTQTSVQSSSSFITNIKTPIATPTCDIAPSSPDIAPSSPDVPTPSNITPDVHHSSIQTPDKPSSSIQTPDKPSSSSYKKYAEDIHETHFSQSPSIKHMETKNETTHGIQSSIMETREKRTQQSLETPTSSWRNDMNTSSCRNEMNSPIKRDEESGMNQIKNFTTSPHDFNRLKTESISSHMDPQPPPQSSPGIPRPSKRRPMFKMVKPGQMTSPPEPESIQLQKVRVDPDGLERIDQSISNYAEKLTMLEQNLEKLQEVKKATQQKQTKANKDDRQMFVINENLSRIQSKFNNLCSSVTKLKVENTTAQNFLQEVQPKMVDMGTEMTQQFNQKAWLKAFKFFWEALVDKNKLRNWQRVGYKLYCRDRKRKCARMLAVFVRDTIQIHWLIIQMYGDRMARRKAALDLIVRAHRSLMARQYKATLIIQKWIRRDRYRLQELRVDRDAKIAVARAYAIFAVKFRSAILIQTQIRMFWARKKLRILKEAHKLVKNAVCRFEQMLYGAKIIQKWRRKIVENRNKAAGVIQFSIIKFLARRRAHKILFSKKLVKHAVTKFKADEFRAKCDSMDKIIRTWKIRWHRKIIKNVQHSTHIVIGKQLFWKLYQVRHDTQLSLNAATKIQEYLIQGKVKIPEPDIPILVEESFTIAFKPPAPKPAPAPARGGRGRGGMQRGAPATRGGSRARLRGPRGR